MKIALCYFVWWFGFDQHPDCCIVAIEEVPMIEVDKYGVIDGEIQIIDVLMTLFKQGKVIAYKFQGARFDCDSVKGHLMANIIFAKAAGMI